jgi:hypothetical protein
LQHFYEQAFGPVPQKFNFPVGRAQHFYEQAFGPVPQKFNFPVGWASSPPKKYNLDARQLILR